MFALARPSPARRVAPRQSRGGGGSARRCGRAAFGAADVEARLGPAAAATTSGRRIGCGGKADGGLTHADCCIPTSVKSVGCGGKAVDCGGKAVDRGGKGLACAVCCTHAATPTPAVAVAPAVGSGRLAAGGAGQLACCRRCRCYHGPRRRHYTTTDGTGQGSGLHDGDPATDGGSRQPSCTRGAAWRRHRGERGTRIPVPHPAQSERDITCQDRCQRPAGDASLDVAARVGADAVARHLDAKRDALRGLAQPHQHRGRHRNHHRRRRNHHRKRCDPTAASKVAVSQQSRLAPSPAVAASAAASRALRFRSRKPIVEPCRPICASETSRVRFRFGIEVWTAVVPLTFADWTSGAAWRGARRSEGRGDGPLAWHQRAEWTEYVVTLADCVVCKT